MDATAPTTCATPPNQPRPSPAPTPIGRAAPRDRSRRSSAGPSGRRARGPRSGAVPLEADARAGVRAHTIRAERESGSGPDIAENPDTSGDSFSVTLEHPV